MQKFKTIYFADHPACSPSKNNIKLAFGEKDLDLYETVASLSSYEVRSLLGHSSFGQLKEAAEQQFLPVSTYCKSVLRANTQGDSASEQPSLLAGDDSGFAIKAVHARYKGGELEPMHDWYPLLEGYSSEFVEKIIEKFCPSANVILDPFAGAGTTPLTVARLGKVGLYAEVNPLLQYLTAVKAKSLTLSSADKELIAEKVRKEMDTLKEAIDSIESNEELSDSYTQVFKGSVFFDDKTYELIIRMRSFLDQVACYEPVVADILTIATLSALIPSSLLIRAGDLRFKREAELTKKTDFLESIISKANKMADDLVKLESIVIKPSLICENAKGITTLLVDDIDAVITSPPYLNGTNYFRNTKVELWFLRVLKTTNDLRVFREKAVTAGINDVQNRYPAEDVLPIIKPIINELQAKAYDQRIPRMVSMYFAEMSLVFEGIITKLKGGSTVAIDIGDSVYGGVHVETDKLLKSLLQNIGFIPVTEIVLRKRLSRGGTPLKQVLLVFSSPKKRKKEKKKAKKPEWKKSWDFFTTSLPHQQKPYSKRNWGHPLHSLCSYGGKMKPSLAHYLVETFACSPDGSLLDPFAGVGTIPFEGALRGCRSLGFEISPAAFIIASAKLLVPDKDECRDLIMTIQAYLRDNKVSSKEISMANQIAFNKPLGSYFEQTTFDEIILARRFFQENPPGDASSFMVMACLLHILHGNRPYALSRRSHGITPFSPTGEFEYRSLIGSLSDKVNRSLDVEYPESFIEGKVFLQDATSWWPQEIDNLDAIITSPPFFDSTRFYLANWLRLWFCGWDRNSFKIMPRSFVDERQKHSFSVYESVFRQSRERLKKDGVMVIHLGQSRKCDMANELTRIAEPWFKVEGLFKESVQHCESHGIRDKGTVTEHQYLILT